MDAFQSLGSPGHDAGCMSASSASGLHLLGAPACRSIHGHGHMADSAGSAPAAAPGTRRCSTRVRCCPALTMQAALQVIKEDRKAQGDKKVGRPAALAACSFCRATSGARPLSCSAPSLAGLRTCLCQHHDWCWQTAERQGQPASSSGRWCPLLSCAVHDLGLPRGRRRT